MSSEGPIGIQEQTVTFTIRPSGDVSLKMTPGLVSEEDIKFKLMTDTDRLVQAVAASIAAAALETLSENK